MQFPKGKLIAIGGAEDKGTDIEDVNRNNLNFFELGILRRIVEEAGGSILHLETRLPLVYNKEDLRNPDFVAMGKER